jgi:hypothetical protein
MKYLYVLVVVLAVFIASAVNLVADSPVAVSVQNPSQDQDGNGNVDAGIVVSGRNIGIYAYDRDGGVYWSDDPANSTVGSVSELNPWTLTVSQFVESYRGTCGNTPTLQDGWVQYHWQCVGWDFPKLTPFNYLLVHKTDPRYTGSFLPEWGGDWEYTVLVEKGFGNFVRNGR